MRRLRIAVFGLTLLMIALQAFAQNASAAASPAQAASPVSASSPLPGVKASRYAGMMVREIRFRGVGGGPEALTRLQQLLAQQVNQPLDRAKVRRSLQTLFATGRFSDLQVEAEPTSQDELTLVFSARENYFIGAVTVDGISRRPSPNQLVISSKLQLGELFTPERVDQAIRAMQSTLMDNGYYKAQITHEEKFNEDTQQVDITFLVNPDHHAQIASVAVEGQSGYSSEQIQRLSGIHPGHTVTAERAAKGLQKLRKKYQKNGRLQAQVAISGRSYRAEDNSLAYALKIDQGPVVDIQVEGVRISRGRLKKLLPVYEEGAVDDDLLNEGLRNLRDYLQLRGYSAARVEWERQSVPGQERTHVIYRVEPGVRHSLQAIRIVGNSYFGTDLIRERMQIHPATGLVPIGLFSDSLLSRDLQSIESMYKGNGFRQVKLSRAVVDSYQGNSGHLLLTIRVDEGPQTKVGRVTLSGNHSFTEADLSALLNTIPGQPYSDSNVAQDRDSILNYYFNRGFPNVRVESAASPAKGDENRFDVAYSINEGERVFVDRVLVAGLNFTRPSVVQRQLQLHTGDALSQMDMLETQRRLYDLGLFTEVGMAVQNPEGQGRLKNVLFQMREAKRWTFNYGFGFQVQSQGLSSANLNQINTAPAPGVSVPPGSVPPGTVDRGVQGVAAFSPDLLFEVSRLNFRGRDHTVSFKGRYGNLEKRALVSYDAPRFLDRDNLRLTFTGLFDNSRETRTFTSDRIEGSVQVQQVLNRVSTLLWRYNYRRVKVDQNSLSISSELVPLLSRPVLVGMPSITYMRDKRDDVLDTRRGNYTTIDFGVSAKAFGSASVSGAQAAQGGTCTGTSTTTCATAANFTRVNAQNSTYSPIGWGIILARTTRIGVENPFGTNASRLAVPLPERFFAGGVISHRGFALNQAGPRDLITGFPVGGNAVFVNSIELRLPPPTLPIVGRNLSFVLFNDSGNVFQNATTMGHSLFRWYQPNRKACSDEKQHGQCRFDYMSTAMGTGIRYKTPIGPARIDFSYNLNPSSFPYYVQCPDTSTKPCGVIPPGTTVFQHGTLRHFNFFFSIGQTF